MSGERLTPRQQEVLDALLAGNNANSIAQTLVISHYTVKRHVTHLRVIYGARHTHALTCLLWRERYDALEARLAECERVRAALDRRGRDRE
jgi:DNA-binding NarL/FixJ family response regulator